MTGRVRMTGALKTALRRTSRLVVSANSRGFSIAILDLLSGEGIFVKTEYVFTAGQISGRNFFGN
jgi:hypothetical protein